jgi:hypothetical protein
MSNLVSQVGGGRKRRKGEKNSRAYKSWVSSNCSDMVFLYPATSPPFVSDYVESFTEY